MYFAYYFISPIILSRNSIIQDVQQLIPQGGGHITKHRSRISRDMEGPKRLRGVHLFQ